VVSCLRSKRLDSAACRSLLGTANGLADLTNACRKAANRDTALCRALNQVLIGLPVPGLGGTPQAGGGAGAGGAPGGGAANPLGDVLGGLGLGRAAPGRRAATSHARLSYEELGALYDPTLVRLLVPGLDTAGEVAR
jgi:phospholipid/cholesterol/gamma-HCH transport system substrate-binding protein